MALSKDVHQPISWQRLTEPVRTIATDIDEFKTLGHVDTLRLLYGHTFSRFDNIRLIGVTDIVEYASRYFEEIDWQRIQSEFPFLINVFRCLHPLIFLPQNLATLAPPPRKALKDVGRGMLPLRDIFSRQNSWKKIFRQLFQPPEWWLHIFYGVAPDKTLLWVKLIGHPFRVASWLTIRLFHKITGNQV